MKLEISHLSIDTYAFDKVEVGKWWDFKNHISPFARIFLVDAGKQEVSFHGKTYHHQRDSLALIPPYTPVDYYCADVCSQYYFIFTCRLENGKDLFTDCRFPYLLSADALSHELCQHLHRQLPGFGLSNVDADSEDFNHMIFRSQLAGLSLQQKLVLQGTVGLLLSRFAADAQRSEQLIRFSKSFQFIETHLGEDLSLAVLADLEGVSKTYFSDQFYEHSGVRPSEYIAHKREVRARELLATTLLNMSEIGHAIGIPDQAYFCRFFKKRTGIAPKKYRLANLIDEGAKARGFPIR
ncbi:AraC family transcriptional regulator [Verrucomicrobiaceae bacterium N1E253]|uniref:AraC family transcriptional regulator n=1 Tax=Oceaniferula marina TaxID=2748318 RepID=A0A851GHG1_9BACT|nr:AraC family transcriptional regulator [Oceaniferula marina]NWK56796.1 AraC family transcriptional regulator [Oceaniferula marina]